jgi:hypothetical protein
MTNQIAIFKDLPKVSTNEIYAGKHWRSRQKMKTDYMAVTQNEIKNLTPITYKVCLDFTFHFKGRTMDSSNTAYMAKLIEDCLVHHGIIKNDNIKFVGKVLLESKKSERDYDYCKLIIREG